MQIPKISLFICTLAVSGSLALHAQDNPAQAAARAALLDKMNELETAPEVATPAPAPTAPIVPATVVVPETAPTVAAPAAATVSLADQKRATEAAKKQAVLEAKQRAANEKAHVVTPVNEPAMELGLTQVNAPAVPLSTIKQQELAGLLQLYKADKLSPEEYQSQRAAILAAP